ncbi:hypothetical protein E2562_035132 [Oryza meyeriana var. granulata]|uniref:Uncharacterized protein n=1 Tax=Oryza meyeriana var. granulata TaxID=110450 RepID=A0A6G1BQG0_9ORYZ|nr:hypothetical protein E2562_035132 [Oryza meyeriana var. granulata]
MPMRWPEMAVSGSGVVPACALAILGETKSRGQSFYAKETMRQAACFWFPSIYPSSASNSAARCFTWLATIGLCTRVSQVASPIGTYSSIAEDLNSKIMEAFALCLAGLKPVVAVDTREKISPNTGNSITGINCTGDRDSNTVVLGVLYAGEVKDFIVQVKFSAKVEKDFHSLGVLTATVNYNDVPRKLSKSSTVQCTLKVHVCATSFAENCTNERTPFPMVLHQMVLFEVLKFMDEFLDRLDAMKNDDGVLLQWDKAKNSDEFSSMKEARRIGVDLGRIDNDIDGMVSCLKRGLGLGCVYSWVLSFQTQRATTTGFPTTAFLTPAMKEMVHKARKQSAEDAAAVTTTSCAAGRTHLAAPPGERFIGKRVVEVLEHITKSLEDMASKLNHGVPSRNSSETQTSQGGVRIA